MANLSLILLTSLIFQVKPFQDQNDFQKVLESLILNVGDWLHEVAQPSFIFKLSQLNAYRLPHNGLRSLTINDNILYSNKLSVVDYSTSLCQHHEPVHGKMYKLTFMNSAYPYQSVHPHSIIKISSVHRSISVCSSTQYNKDLYCSQFIYIDLLEASANLCKL